MQQPLVSVIVPIYNAKNHLARCVESIRRQTYRNLEILLLNDGSSDVSLQLCRMYAGVDSRITVIDKANSGVAATRNLGLQEARGAYLQFVDADDTLQPNATELLVNAAEGSGADLVIAHYNRINPPKLRPGEREEEAMRRPVRVQTFGFLMEGALDKAAFVTGLMQEPASFYYGVMWNKLYRADIVKAHEDIVCAEELDWSEDLYFNLSYIRYAESFYALSTPVYNYYNTPGSAVHTALDPVNMVTTRLTLAGYYKNLYEELGVGSEAAAPILKYLFGVAEH